MLCLSWLYEMGHSSEYILSHHRTCVVLSLWISKEENKTNVCSKCLKLYCRLLIKNKGKPGFLPFLALWKPDTKFVVPFYVLTFYILLHIIIIIWEVEREREHSPLLDHSPNVHNGYTWARLKWEPGTQPRSPVWLTGTQLLEPSLAVLQSEHSQEAGIGCGAWTRRSDTGCRYPNWCLNCEAKCCWNTHTKVKMYFIAFFSLDNNVSGK